MVRKLKNIELNRPSIEEFKAQEKYPVRLLLDNIRSMMNVGSAFRTADAMAIEKIYLGGITAQPPHREITKTAIGAEKSMDWEHVSDPVELVRNLKQEGYKIAGVEQVENSLMLNDWSPDTQSKWLLIVGNEVEGVQDNLLEECDVIIEIPQFGTKHSLNVSVSTGMVLWELVKRWL